MTRINCIDPELLSDQHLMAEYRELPMVAAALKRSLGTKTPIWKKIPPNYTMGKGHVSFFYNKGRYLEQRMDRIQDELFLRDYDIDPEKRNISFDIFRENNLYANWIPSWQDHLVNADRIIERMADKPDFYTRKKRPMNRHFLRYEIRGYSRVSNKGNLGICGLKSFIYTVAIVCDINEIGYHHRYCFNTWLDAVESFNAWDGNGHPPGNWIKRKGLDGEFNNPNYEGSSYVG